MAGFRNALAALRPAAVYIAVQFALFYTAFSALDALGRWATGS